MNRTLLLLTGWGSTHRVWDLIIPALPASYHIINVIPPWLQNSQIAASLADLDAYVDALAAKITAPVDVLGWSLGGLIALRLSQRHPASVNKLVLVSSTPKFVAPDNHLAGLDYQWFNEFKHQFQQQPEKTLKRFQSMLVAGDQYGREVLRHLRSDGLTAEFNWTECNLGLAVLEHDLGQAYQDLDRPCCFIHGRNDRVVNAQSVMALTQQTPAELVLLDDTGHVPQLSNPELLAHHVNTFLLPAR
mgnify:CR=1 FL=1